MKTPEHNTVECPSCGAHFDRSLPACPYCGSTNPEGAEKAYMEDLGEIREDLADLTDTGIDTVSKEVRKHGKFLRRTLVIAGVTALIFAGMFFFTENRWEKKAEKDFQWQRENYPVMDELYESGDYRALAEFYLENGAEGNPVWSYSHAGLCEAVLSMERLDDLLEEEKRGAVPDSTDLEWILEDELTVLLAEYQPHITKEDLEWIKERAYAYEEDFRARFSMDDEILERFRKYAEESGGYVDTAAVKEYVGNMAEK